MMLPRDLGQSVESGKDYRFECVDGLNDHFGLGEVGKLYLGGNIKLFPATDSTGYGPVSGRLRLNRRSRTKLYQPCYSRT